MRILLVDDEKLARARLREMLAGIGGHSVVGEATNGSEAIEKTTQLKPDALLMDIRMPVMDGLEAAMHLAKMDQPPAVIFTTAYDQHAVEAFEVNAVDYLLKPVRQDRLASALEKVKPMKPAQLRDVSRAHGEHPRRSHISVHMRGQITLIPVPEIVYFMADSKYVTVRTAREQHLIEESLVNLEQEFDGDFLRVHRNALIAVNQVRGLEKQASGHWAVLLKSVDDKVPVSRRHTPAVRRWIRRT
jgi:two-component system response regulator AlgR